MIRRSIYNDCANGHLNWLCKTFFQEIFNLEGDVDSLVSTTGTKIMKIGDVKHVSDIDIDRLKIF